jgi:hypothetical protein
LNVVFKLFIADNSKVRRRKFISLQSGLLYAPLLFFSGNIGPKLGFGLLSAPSISSGFVITCDGSLESQCHHYFLFVQQIPELGMTAQICFVE